MHPSSAPTVTFSGGMLMTETFYQLENGSKGFDIERGQWCCHRAIIRRLRRDLNDGAVSAH